MSKQKPFGNIPYSQGSYATPGMGYGQACRNVNKQTKVLVVIKPGNVVTPPCTHFAAPPPLPVPIPDSISKDCLLASLYKFQKPPGQVVITNQHRPQVLTYPPPPVRAAKAGRNHFNK
jgi:hypothetical protein